MKFDKRTSDLDKLEIRVCFCKNVLVGFLVALLEFRTINGRGPSAEHQEADGNHLSEVRSMVLEHLGVGSDYIPEDYFK